MREIPEITSSRYSYSAEPVAMFVSRDLPENMRLQEENKEALRNKFIKEQQDFRFRDKSSSSSPSGSISSTQMTEVEMDQRRLVQVFIVDPDDELPLEHALLYSGEQQLTDLTNQELFFEIDIKTILNNHNKIRTNTLDKEATKLAGKKSFLEPVRIRDLKMTVVEIAVF